jgi:hypothetical protein
MQPFVVGEKVTSDFFPREVEVVRTVTKVKKDKRFKSGWEVAATNGAGTNIWSADSGRFRRYEGEG